MADEFVYDASNEAIVIGNAIADADARKTLVHRLAADEFLVDKHAIIWRALRELSDGALEYDHETMRQLVIRNGGDRDVVTHLENIESEARAHDNIEWHADTMAWDATRARTLDGPVPELLKSLKDTNAEKADVLTAARSIVRALGDSSRTYMHRPEELQRAYRAELAARRVSRNVYPLGHAPFDRRLSEGFMPRRTTVTAGLPGAGKSTVWAAMAIMLAKLGRRPMYCAWEMDAESILDVMISHMTGIPLVQIIQGTFNDEDAARITKASAWITKRIRFMGNPFPRAKGKPSNDRNLDALEGYIAESGCDVVVYDLWERMLVWRRPEDVSGALFRMQDIHSEYRVHGVIVQQLTLKDVEKRSDKRPTREAIKGTGAYVEVADLIFGIHRVGQFKDVEDNTLETICLKQRKGAPNWAIQWKWDGATCGLKSPKEVPFNPGLAEQVGEGDIIGMPTSIKGIKVGGGGKPGRGEQ